jgi:beta-lactamase regulating signal transducer with metallopeptidase domain
MQSFINTLLICSITMSALAIIYMASTPLLAKQYSEKGCYYTWLVVVIGLIIPFRPQWGNTIFQAGAMSETVKSIMQTGKQIVSQAIILQKDSIPLDPVPPNQIPLDPTPLTPSTILTTTDTTPLYPTLASNVSWWQIAAIIWLVGLTVFLAYHVIKHWRFTKMVRRWSEKIEDGRTNTFLQGLLSEMKISKPIKLYQCSSIGSPMMIGIINPRILLPRADLAQDELCFVLKHELIHYKRKDLYYKCLVLIATAIHWFNPIVYLIARAIAVQCELSCDAETVRNADVRTRQHYSETIISLMKYRSRIKTVFSTNFNTGRKGMKKRIVSITDMGKKKSGAAIICMVFILSLVIGGYSNASTPDNNPSSGNTQVKSRDIDPSLEEGSSATAGDILQLGGLDWRVLDIRDGNALVISEKVLLKMPYHAPPIGEEIVAFAVTWEECDLRNYLNQSFYNSFFSEEEKMRIVETPLISNINPEGYGGKITVDKVFLLSTKEVLLYFGASGELENQPSKACIAETQDGNAAWWWLRSPVDYVHGNHAQAATVLANGGLGIGQQGDYVSNKHGGVRPALWLKL